MIRRQDWQERLSSVIDAARDRPFVWGKHDCALFAAECVAAMTGEDFAAPFRGRYSNPSGAARALKRFGYTGIEDLCTKSLGEPHHGPLYAQRGDIVLLDGGNGPQLGVCIGAVAATPCGDGRLICVAMTRWLKAWRV